MTMKIELNNRSMQKITSQISIVLKGISQIMLQESAITGLLFLIGIFYGSVNMGLAAILATSVGTLTAKFFKYNQENINKGLYGFSPALVGVAIMLFIEPLLLSWVLVIIGALLAAVIQNFFIKKKIAVFTFPFVLVTWGILYLTSNFIPAILVEPFSAASSVGDFYTFGFKGYGQVIFQGSLLAGVLFFIGVFITSPISALYGFLGAILSGILAFKLSASVDAINMGLFSYNAVLCAIVFAGNQVKDGMWAMISILISLALSFLMSKYELIALTFPFVFATSICVFLKSKTKFDAKKSYADALQSNE